MNREILFRGKRIDNGEWVYGDLQLPSSHYFNPCICFWLIEHPGAFKRIEIEVDPDTLGQFTGLTDKNGAKIFEGDMVLLELQNRQYTVEFSLGCFYAIIDGMKPSVIPDKLGVITGNIHDNADV